MTQQSLSDFFPGSNVVIIQCKHVKMTTWLTEEAEISKNPSDSRSRKAFSSHKPKNHISNSSCEKGGLDCCAGYFFLLKSCKAASILLILKTLNNFILLFLIC